MLTTRLRQLLSFGVGLFIAHGIEEWATGFYFADPTFPFVASLVTSEQEAVFVVFQLMLWLLLVLAVALLLGERWRIRALTAFGVLLVLEVEHLILVAINGHYYPGAVTSALFIPAAILYWRELLRAKRMLRSAQSIRDPVKAIDVVCGMEVDRRTAISCITNGRTFFFCSPECRDRFLVDPGQFAQGPSTRALG
ncbi:MAG: YHS domain-containing protein [Vicinamibacterales bacterium]